MVMVTQIHLKAGCYLQRSSLVDKFMDLCFSKYLLRISTYIDRQSVSKLKRTEQFTCQAGG